LFIKKDSRMKKRFSLLFITLIASLWMGTTLVSAQDDFRALLASLPQGRQADGGFVIGDPSAPITIVEFADFACPHCQTYREVTQQVIEQYVATGQARFEFRTFPTAGGRRTIYAAVVAECADVMVAGGFWQAHELLYEYAQTGRYQDPLGKLIATELGADYLSMLGCMWRGNQILTDYELATTLGVSGTPAVAVRYDDGDLAFITHEGTTYDRGSVPIEVLSAVIEAANQ